MYDSGPDIRPNALKNPGADPKTPNPFSRGGVWLWRSGAPELAAPISPDSLAAAHPVWAADMARLGPWQAVTLGGQAGPAAGDWLVAQGDAGQVSDPVLCVGECASSLDVGWAFAAAGLLPPFASVLALAQTQGRGQMRRGWQSPPGNLYAALAWPEAAGALAAMAPVVLGYCLAGGLAQRGFEVLVKWPNDLLLGGGKVGGILLEERGGRTLAGVGVNLACPPDAARLRRDHAAPAASLAAFGEVPGAVTVWTELVKSVQTCYRHSVVASDSRGLPLLLAQRLAWLGREVLVRESGSDAFRARIMGLAEDGGLRLRRVAFGPDRDLTLHSGSISLL